MVSDDPAGLRNRPPLTVERMLFTVALVTLLLVGCSGWMQRLRIQDNERSACGTLRTLSTSESGFQSAAIVDTDGDGTGEFGFLAELSGASGYRTASGISANPTSPAFITSVLGTTARRNGGVGERAGYYYLVYLPTDRGPAVAESDPLAPGVAADANRQEVAFVCYAWPVRVGVTGRRAFVVSQQGEVFATDNHGYQNYSGLDHRPAPGAAYVASDSEHASNLEGQFLPHAWAGDGFVWQPAGN